MNVLRSTLPLLLLPVALQALASQQTLRDTDTFAEARLSNAEVREIIAAVEPIAYDTPDSWRDELRAKRIDLGGSPGIVIQGRKLLCGGTGNCQIFVFRKINGKWKSLFTEQAPVGEAFELGPGTSNGIKDLTVSANTSADAAQRVTYRFDGEFFRRK